MADWDLTTAAANTHLELYFRNNLYLALYTAVPAADGTGGTECSFTGYARVQLTTSNMAAASARSITNSATLDFGTSSSSTQTATHYAIMSASSGGTMSVRGELTSSYVIASGTPVKYAPGAFVASDPAIVT
jgi:hypothetical protein